MKNEVIVVGGGTAGLVSALILEQAFDVNIKIIKSDKLGIIGVGEGSTEHWDQFLSFCRIDYKELIKETDATIKLGIYFTNGWASNDFFHNIGSFKTNCKLGQINYGMLDSLSKKEPPIITSEYFALKNLVRNSEKISKQYHFNTHKLNSFLLKKCKERNITIIDDFIKEVEVNEKGIHRLIGSSIYQGDFYIDCSGFKKVLISKLGAKWISYKDYLTMNEAIAFPTGDTDEYTPYTESKRTSAGWMWRIPTFGRWGNGHVYNSNLINADQAKQEAEKHLGYSIEVAKHVKFDPGALDKCLIKNCLAVGLAANFVEPLEASSIGTTINQMMLFNNYFMHTNLDYFEDEYNHKMNVIMQNIRDFVLIHYLNMKDIKLPYELNHKLKMWKIRPPIDDDFKDTEYTLFNAQNFTQVLCGMDFYASNEIKNYLDNLGLWVKINYNKLINEQLELYDKSIADHISHKKWLEGIRNGNR
jgi:hypothetical protein